MLELPKSYKEKIVNRYGDKINDWLDNIDTIVDKYIKKFDLVNVELYDKLSMNLVLFATSKKYGEVILKVGTPGTSIIDEINYLNSNTSRYMVKCLYSNIDDKVIIIERIVPGVSLGKMNDIDNRIKTFCFLVRDLAINTGNVGIFKTYEDSLGDKLSSAQEDGTCFQDIISMLKQAIIMYNEIKELRLPKYVLHGDLHLNNILESNGIYKVIDPHGVVGELVFDTCQYIKSELINMGVTKENIKFLAEKVAAGISEDTLLIYKAFYIETTTKIYYYKKANYDTEIVEMNSKICGFLQELINLV